MNTANTTINGFLHQFRTDRTKRNRMFTFLLVLSLLVAVAVFYQLRLTALTLAGDADCGYTEHVHSEACLEKTLVCGLAETAGHVHSAENGCYAEETVLICTSAEHTHSDACYTMQVVYDCTEEHEHTADCPSHEESILTCETEEHTHSADTCYTAQQTLTCTQEEAAQSHVHGDACYETSYVCGFDADYEHVHTTDCYSDDTADVETAAVWEATLKDAELTGEWPADLLAVAQTQLGYTESTANWRVDEEHNKKGYTRYGAWYGFPYGDWCAMFVSFCMNYAEIPEDVIPQGAGCESWLTALEQEEMFYKAESYTPQAGDIVFFDYASNGASDHVGIVKSVDESGNITTIEGNTSNSVAYRDYEPGSASILGYCPVGEIYAAYAQSNMLMTASNSTSAIGYARWDYTGDVSDWTELVNYTIDYYNADDTVAQISSKGPGFVYASMTPIGSISSREYYVIDADTYSSLESQAYNAAGQAKLEKASQVAYCYNYTAATPARWDGYSTTDENIEYYGSALTSYIAYYTKATASTDAELEALFQSSATANSSRTPSDGTSLRHKLISVVLNGYPHNRAGIQERYGLTDGQFRAMTQYAIWYYTDSLEVQFNSSYYARVVDKDGNILTDAANSGYNDKASADIQSAWNALIASNVNFGDGESAYINLYNTSSYGLTESGSIGQYQNLLTVGVSDVEEPDTTTQPATVRIQAQKTMDGSVPAEGAFEFKLYTKESNAYTEVFPDAYQNDQYGYVTFPAITLPDGEGTYTYYIKEVNGGDTAIEYDTEYKPVTVQVYTSQKITEFETSTLYGYETGSFDPGLSTRYVNVNGKSYAAYCINVSGGTAHGSYGYILDPTTDELKREIKADTYSGNLKEDLRKVVYYFRDKEYGDTLSYTLDGAARTLTLNYSIPTFIVWYMTGDTGIDWTTETMRNIGFESEAQVKAIISAILTEAEKTITDDYKLVMLTGEDTYGWGQQPIVIGLDTTTVTVEGSTETRYAAVQTTTPVVENTTKVSGNSLQLTKQVSGSEGDKSKLFSFTVNLWTLDADGKKTSAGVAGDLTVALSGGATAQNNSLTDGKANFSVSGDAGGTYAWHIFKLAHGQSATITNLPDGVYYEIVETDYSAEGYTTTVNGAEGSTASGSISGSATVAAAFTNKKGGDGYSAQIKATKTVDGLAPEKDQIFTFDLYDSDGNWLAEAKNDAAGNIVFPAQTYDKAGVYTYTIRERAEDPTKYTYAGEQTVTVMIGTNTELSKVLTAAKIEGVEVGDTTGLKAKLTYSDGSYEYTDVWCIDNDQGTPPDKTYEANLNPTEKELAEYTTSKLVVPKPDYSQTDIREALRRAVYWLPKQTGTRIELGEYGYEYGTLTYWIPDASTIQAYIWWLTGATNYNSGGLYYVNEHSILFPALFKYLEDKGEPEEPFELVLFAPTDGGQPIVAGYTLAVDSSDDITVSEASFNNTTTPTKYTVKLSAKKTLGGETPGADDVFTFRLLDENLKELQRTTNNGGDVKFYLTLTEAKTYTFYIEEVAGDDTSIRYDTTRHVYTVTVTPGSSASSVLNAVIQAGGATISSQPSTNGGYRIAGDTVTTHYGYALYNGTNGSSPGYYGTAYTVSDADVTSEDLEGYVQQNNFGNDLLPNMKKVLYAFSQKKTYDTMGGFTLSDSNRQRVMGVLCGTVTSENTTSYVTYKAILDAILEAYPNDPGGELAIFTASGYSPVIAYYEADGEATDGTVSVIYNNAELSDTNQPVIANRRTTGRVLPGTGGPGMIPHVVIGIALMTGTVLYSGYRLRHKRERRFQ